jgi:hypothetical protein
VNYIENDSENNCTYEREIEEEFSDLFEKKIATLLHKRKISRFHDPRFHVDMGNNEQANFGPKASVLTFPSCFRPSHRARSSLHITPSHLPGFSKIKQG